MTCIIYGSVRNSLFHGVEATVLELQKNFELALILGKN